MIIHARTPTRIDLAGGTLDIPPLYLFEDGGLTLNVSTTVYSEVSVEILDSGVELISNDTGAVLAAPNYDELEMSGELDLVARIVRFYRPGTGVRVRTHCQAPKGSGLGASSSLLIALSGALNRALGDKYSRDEIINIGANLEAQCIRVPTGKQDYYGAMYSGVKAIWFGVDRDVVEPLVVDERTLRMIEERLILTFTGLSHFSGATNWDMFRGYIDNVAGVRLALRTIKQTAVEMRAALLSGEVDEFAQLLDQEWENRKALSEGVTTSEIDHMVHSARQAGALASKICGAGGGGCMLTVAPDGDRKRVERALQDAGARLLPFRIDREGLQVW
jgi:D-glycero-alpha-D-manno-heptose-7-phosphate kinase